MSGCDLLLDTLEGEEEQIERKNDRKYYAYDG